MVNLLAEAGVSTSKVAASAGLSLIPAKLLFVLMGMNFVGWLGAWLAEGFWAWLLGFLFAYALAFGFAVLWTGVIAPHPAAKKMPAPVAGALYGVVVALVFSTLVPIVLSAIAGGPSMVESNPAEGLLAAFGARVVPALPDLGFKPPLSGLSERDWVSLDDHVGRLLPFTLAFMLFGITLQLLTGKKK